MYLLTGEIIPIGFVFWYHYRSAPKIQKAEQEVEEREHLNTDMYNSRMTQMLHSPETFEDEEARGSTFLPSQLSHESKKLSVE